MSTVPRETRACAPRADQCLEAVSSLNQVGFIAWDCRHPAVHVSDLGRELLGLAPDRFVYVPELLELVEADESRALHAAWQQGLAQGQQRLGGEFSARLANGEERRFSAYALITFRTDGSPATCVVALQDITSQCATLKALSESEARLEEAQHIAHFGFWEMDMIREAVVMSDEARTMLRCGPEWMADRRSLIELVPEDQRDWVLNQYKEAYAQRLTTLRYEVRHPDPDGSTRDIHTLAKIDYDQAGAPRRILATVQDISELKAYRRQLHSLAFFDPVTQLPNRSLFVDRLTQALTDASWHHQQLGVIMLDLDRFKDINDTLGHSAGDELLKQAAQRLQQVLRGYDTVARIGGDEFAVVLPEVRHATDLGGIASKVLGAFTAPFSIAGQSIFVTTSVGGAIYPDDAQDVDQLLQYADAALYHAKAKGRNNFQFYSRELTAQASERLTLENELRTAIDGGELELYYQPKFDLATGGLLGAEALMRWNHPQRGMVPPLSFISLAEDTGLIVPIGAWALRTACAEVAKWNARRAEPLKMAVNLSARQFAAGPFTQTVLEALAAGACKPAWLELEITESLLLDGRDDVRTVLEEISHMGVSIAIDDFGTGYSALSYLTRFPVNTLKIDRSFVKDLPGDRGSAELVKAIISLGRSLEMHLVAEGVETREQADHLNSLGCQMVQGFLFGKPMNAAAFEKLLAA